MMSYFSAGMFNIPVYGFLALMGTVVCNIIAMWISRADREKWKNYCLIEIVAGTGAVFGAKALTLLSDIVDGSGVGFTWENFKDTGYSYYGGLAGFFFFAGILIKICSMDRKGLEKKFLFLLPLQHSLWKIGCLMGGCCYGIPYDGIGAVVFPEGSYAIPGIKLFPVQLVESACLMIIAFAILYLQIKKQWYYTVETYLILYAILRFCLENLRYDAERGYYAGLSTSQWISIGFLVAAMVSVVWQKKRKNQRFKSTILEEKK